MESFVGRSFDLSVMQEQRKKRVIYIAAVLAGAAVLVVLGFVFYRWYVNRSFETYKVVHTASVKNGTSLEYASYNGGVIRYGRDGVTAADENGDSLWNGSYDMANPRLDICEKSAVVADIGGTSFYAYKGQDTGVNFSVDFPIVQACISRQGIVAVLTEESASNTITLYNPFDKTDKLLAEIPTNVEDGYPVSVAISPDGNSVAASYLCVTTGAVQSRVAFYNFTEIGKNANCLVGAKNYDETVISEIRFVDEEHVCLFGEDGFYLWENMKQPKQRFKKRFEDTIQSAFCGEGYVGVVLDQGGDSHEMRLYSAGGKRTLKEKVDADYAHVQIRGDEILFDSSDKIAVYRTNGVKKCAFELKNKISYFYKALGRNDYILIQNSKIKKIKLK